MRLHALALVAALASMTTACSWVKASPGDYGAYRKTRVEKTFDARITAANAYLHDYPNGAYAPQVRRWFDRVEPIYYETREKTEAGLEAYLVALPDGPHSTDVRSRLRAIEAQRNSPDPLLVAAASTEARLAAAEASRDRVRTEFDLWAQNLADPAAYKTPLAEGPADLVVGFSLSLPAPVCRPTNPGRICEKDVTIPFLVPTRDGLRERELAFTITLEQDDAGRPQRARIEGEELFSRLEEAYSKKQLDAGAIDDRVAAVARAVEIISGAFEAKVSLEPTCRKDVTVPDIAKYECNGMRVRGVAGTNPGAADVIFFEPSLP